MNLMMQEQLVELEFHALWPRQFSCNVFLIRGSNEQRRNIHAVEDFQH